MVKIVSVHAPLAPNPDAAKLPALLILRTVFAANLSLTFAALRRKSDFPWSSYFRVLNLRGTAMIPETLESFVDADHAAKFLSLSRRRVLDLARAGKLPGHPIGDGARQVWRFRLTELAAAMSGPQKSGFISRERAAMVRPQTISGERE